MATCMAQYPSQAQQHKDGAPSAQPGRSLRQIPGNVHTTYQLATRSLSTAA